MRRRRIVTTLIVLAAAAALAGGVAYAVGRSDDDSPSESRSELAFMKAHVDEAAVSQDQAEAAALQAQPGTVLESELEGEGGGLIWEVEIDDGSSIHEVTVDAQTGEVLGGEAEEAEEAEGNDD